MSKFNSGNIKIDNKKKIIFIDKYNNKHKIQWDDANEQYIFDGIVNADGYINATNSHIDTRSPNVSDISYIIPTIWINTSDMKVHILKNINNGIALWDELTTGSTGVIDERITINAGGPANEPTTPQPYYMWVEMPG